MGKKCRFRRRGGHMRHFSAISVSNRSTPLLARQSSLGAVSKAFFIVRLRSVVVVYILVLMRTK